MESKFKVLPIFKSHYSAGKSILTLDKPTGKEDSYPCSIFDLLINNKLDTLILFDDCVSGILEANNRCQELKINFIFGVRLWVTHDMDDKSEESLYNRARYVVVAKNLSGYEDIIKIWSEAATRGFYYEPCIDFKTLRSFWNPKNLKLVVPFYDSFLHRNVLESHKHVPEYDFAKPLFLVEDNNLPFDSIIQNKVRLYTEGSFTARGAQSIYYKNAADFEAYMTRRCIDNRTTMNKPNLDHMCSDEFSFSKWQKLNS